MPRIAHRKAAEAESRTQHQAPLCEPCEAVLSRRLEPPQASLWLVASELRKDSEIRWKPGHGDEALYVRAGSLEVNGQPCVAGAAAILEAGSQPRVRALEATCLLHFGSRVAPASQTEQGVHVTTPRGTWEQLGPGRETRFFADATCERCSIWLLYTARAHAFESSIHSHSQDELIHVLEGEIELGSLHIAAGDTLFVAADQLYRLRAGDSGFAFLNFRRAGSRMRVQGRDELLVESGATTGMQRVE